MGRSSVVAFVFTALMGLPMTGLAQAPSSAAPGDPLRLALPDPVGDLRTEDGEVVPGPGFMDITMLEVAVDGDDLAVTVEVAGDLSDALVTSPSPVYMLMVTAPGTDVFDWHLVVPADDWAVSTMFSSVDEEPVSIADASGSRIHFRVPRPRWVAPGKLRLSALMGATTLFPFGDLDRDLPEFDEGTGARLARSPDPTDPPDPPTIELAWPSLNDSVPDSPDQAGAWVTLDGSTGVYAGRPEPRRSPLRIASTTRRILGQANRRVAAPGVDRLRQRTKAIFEAYGYELAAMPALDGVGGLDIRTDLDELLELTAAGVPDPEASGDRSASRLVGASHVAAAFIYIAERTESEELKTAAADLADGFHDQAVAIVHGKRKGQPTRADRRHVARAIREVIEGFAW